MSIQKIYDKAKEIKEKYDNENIYKLAEYIEKNNKAREAYNKFIQRNNAFKKADKALIATIANNYDAIAEEVKKSCKKGAVTPQTRVFKGEATNARLAFFASRAYNCRIFLIK